VCKQGICISMKYYTRSDDIDIENVFLVVYQSRTQMWMSTESVLSLWLIMQCVSACVSAQRADVRGRSTAWRLVMQQVRHAWLNTSCEASPPPHHVSRDHHWLLELRYWDVSRKPGARDRLWISTRVVVINAYVTSTLFAPLDRGRVVDIVL